MIKGIVLVGMLKSVYSTRPTLLFVRIVVNISPLHCTYYTALLHLIQKCVSSEGKQYSADTNTTEYTQLLVK